MKLKKVLVITFLIILFIFIFCIIQILIYAYDQNKNSKSIEYCRNLAEKFDDGIIDTENPGYYTGRITNPDSCYCKMYNLLLPRFLVYKVKSGNKDLKFIRYSKSIYIVPTVILEKADSIISYGIWGESSFESNVANLYRKNVYAYDCGVRNINKKNPRLFFKSECIGTDKYILTEHGQISSKKVHTFGEKLKELKLENKKIFLKVDIAGAEIEVIPDIVKYADNLTGIALVVRLDDTKIIVKMNELLKMIEKDFVLVARNQLIDECKYGCKCRYISNEISPSVCLTYINKNLVDKKYLPIKQDYHDTKNYIQCFVISPLIPDFNIDWRVVIYEKIKRLFHIENEFIDSK